MSSSLLTVGSVAFDSIETRAGKRNEILGGAATYISLCASMFAPVNLVGVIGDGDFPQEHIDMLTSKGINISGLEKAPGKTFRWSGKYADDFSSRTTLDTQLGVFEHFDPKIPAEYANPDILMLGNIDPGLQAKILDTVGDSSYVITDTMNLWIDIALEKLKAVIRRTDLLVINDEESAMLTGEMQVSAAADKILADGPGAVIIKRGEHGAYLFTKDTVFFAPAFPLKDVVDPTGAGDSFAGGLAGYLTQAESTNDEAIKKGMIYGSAAASHTCEDFGVENLKNLQRPAVDARFEQLRKLVSLK